LGLLHWDGLLKGDLGRCRGESLVHCHGDHSLGSLDVRISLEGLQGGHLDGRSDVLCRVDGLLDVLNGGNSVSLGRHSSSCDPKSFIPIVFKSIFEGIGRCLPRRKELALVDGRRERGRGGRSDALARFGTSLSGTLWRRFIDVVASLELYGKLIEAVTVIVIVARGVAFWAGGRGGAACVGLDGVGVYDGDVVFLCLNSPGCLGFV
jgi:hypothetical protein